MTEQDKVQTELMIKAQEYAWASMAEGVTLEQALSRCEHILSLSEGVKFLGEITIKFTYAGGSSDFSKAL